jgi:DNA-directed RNA polymerase sigma subunit (sigma70/sigma32)
MNVDDLREKEEMYSERRETNEYIGERSLDLYLKEINNTPLLTREQEKELAKKIRKEDQRALHDLVKANLRFVVSIAKQYVNQGLSLADLVNEGNLGLIKAAYRFDEKRGYKFISYAVWWIRQAMLQALAEQSRIVRLPPSTGRGRSTASEKPRGSSIRSSGALPKWTRSPRN